MSFARTETVGGVVATSADVNGFTVSELRFPSGYVQAPLDPDAPYLAFVLEGSLEKSFQSRAIALESGRGLTIPVGACHGARFGPDGARIAIVRLRDPSRSSGARACFDLLAELRAPHLAWLAARMTDELRASDTAAPLAAEGYALELLAATSRQRTGETVPRRTPVWLREAEEHLRVRGGECVRLGELAEAVGVHPARLARGFRERHGISVGEYGRRLRLERAAAELAATDAPLAAIAADAGFADQSHFTRLFRRHHGTTPARYRLELRSPRVPAS